MANVFSNMTDPLNDLKYNQAMVFESERKEYWYWNKEGSVAILIANYHDVLPSYFRVVSAKKGFVTVECTHFHRTVRHKLKVDFINPRVFSISVGKLQKQSEVNPTEKTDEIKEVSNG
jgi:hypothetical protein